MILLNIRAGVIHHLGFQPQLFQGGQGVFLRLVSQIRHRHIVFCRENRWRKILIGECCGNTQRQDRHHNQRDPQALPRPILIRIIIIRIQLSPPVSLHLSSLGRMRGMLTSGATLRVTARGHARIGRCRMRCPTRLHWWCRPRRKLLRHRRHHCGFRCIGGTSPDPSAGAGKPSSSSRTGSSGGAS